MFVATSSAPRSEPIIIAVGNDPIEGVRTGPGETQGGYALGMYDQLPQHDSESAGLRLWVASLKCKGDTSFLQPLTEMSSTWKRHADTRCDQAYHGKRQESKCRRKNNHCRTISKQYVRFSVRDRSNYCAKSLKDATARRGKTDLRRLSPYTLFQEGRHRPRRAMSSNCFKAEDENGSSHPAGLV